ATEKNRASVVKSRSTASQTVLSLALTTSSTSDSRKLVGARGRGRARTQPGWIDHHRMLKPGVRFRIHRKLPFSFLLESAGNLNLDDIGGQNMFIPEAANHTCAEHILFIADPR